MAKQQQEKRKIMIGVGNLSPEFVEGTHWTVGEPLQAVTVQSDPESLIIWDNESRVAQFHRLHWTLVKFAGGK